jgi:hypothetical protein
MVLESRVVADDEDEDDDAPSDLTVFPYIALE